MDRRSFIKLTAITGTSATLAGCGVPDNQIIRFVPEEELVPGVAEWKPGVCTLCSSGCGLSVRVMQADVETSRNGQAGVVRMGVAKKLEGSAAHPVNRGGLCARGQAAIQVTYHPDRIVQPIKRSGARGDGSFEAMSWDDAIAAVVQELDTLESAGDQKSLAFITGSGRSRRRGLLAQFAAKFGAPPPMAYSLFDEPVLRHANALSFGQAQLPTFDLGRARFVISFGADFLGTWNSPVAQSAAYSDMRNGRVGIRGAFVQIESRMTPTGASADQWIPVTPGTEGVLALGIAHVLLRDKLRPAAGAARAGALIEGWAGGLADYAPEQVQQRTGVTAARVERLAHEFAALAPSVAIVGGPPLAQTNGLFTALAVNALNALAGSVGTPGGLYFTPQIAEPEPLDSRLDRFAADVLSGARAPKVLFVDGANPIFTAPRGWKVREALDKIPVIISFGSFIDETTVLSDLILPDHSFLESWSDAEPESGSLSAIISVAAPAMKPLYQTRPAPDVLLDIAHKLRKPLDLPWQTFDEMLKASIDKLGEDAWTTAQQQGGWWGEPPKSPARTAGAPRATAAPKAVAFAQPQYQGDAGQYPYVFLPYASTAFLDGSLAHLPFLQEMPDPITSAMWSTWIEINPKTAAELGVTLGDVVEVASPAGQVRAPAFINPGLAPNIIAMPVGQGHQTFTRYASGRGANPVELLAPASEPETGALAWAATRVKVARVGDPDGRLILFSARGELREEPNAERGR